MIDDARSELVDPGTLRVGINLGNILLVTGTSPNGDPEGVAPDMAALVAERLGVGVSFVTFDTPGEVADAVEQGGWDIGLIAIEPKRAEKIAFCDAYVEIEGTYLLPENSPLQTIEDVDQPGVRIAVSERAAYDLYLTRTLTQATLHRAKGLAGALTLFKTDTLDALAGLRPALKDNANDVPGSRVLDGCYTTVRQAIGTSPACTALNAAVEQVIADAKKSGFVADLIEKHGVTGKLQVAGNG